MQITTDMLHVVATAGRAATSLLASDVPAAREPAILLATASSELVVALDAVRTDHHLEVAEVRLCGVIRLAAMARAMIDDMLPGLAGVGWTPREHRLLEGAIDSARAIETVCRERLQRLQDGMGIELLEVALGALGQLAESDMAHAELRKGVTLGDVVAGLNALHDKLDKATAK